MARSTINSIRLSLYILLLSCTCCMPDKNKTSSTQKPRTYYISNSGNDSSDGTRSVPWQTIAKLNNTRLMAGDSVCFEGGQIFNGHILLDSTDAGTTELPVTITSVGNGKAVIDGKEGTALTVYNTKHINISTLIFRGAGRKTGNTKDGVIINNSVAIGIDSIDIIGFQKAGLLINTSKSIKVKRVYATENGSAGIFITGEYQKKNCSDILISYCTAVNNPGDPTNLNNHSGNGILAGECKNVKIEYCVATNNGWDMPRKGNGPVGIWCYEADSVIIEHCISYKNKTAPGAADGGGFDLDGGVTNSIIQYCLSYENEGSGFGIFQYEGAGKWNNNTIRYCISENDGSVSPAHAGVFIWNSSRDTSQFRNCYFYNNIVYNSRGAAISYEPSSENSGFRFYNNIFVAKDSLIIGKETNSVYLGNNWYSLKYGFNAGGISDFREWTTKNRKETIGGKLVGLNIDPGFANAGKTTVVTPARLNSFNNYRLPENSILRNSGIDLKKMFGIETGGQSFNQSTARSNGIGAFF